MKKHSSREFSLPTTLVKREKAFPTAIKLLESRLPRLLQPTSSRFDYLLDVFLFSNSTSRFSDSSVLGIRPSECYSPDEVDTLPGS
jgi:hypothetical protein